jgi:alkylhydroperoxidase family enzyme
VSGAVGPKENALFEHQPQAGDDLSAREALAVSLAERIALDPHTVTDSFFESLKAEFSEDEIAELVFACGIFNWGNKFNITMQLDSSPDSAYETEMQYRQEEIG